MDYWERGEKAQLAKSAGISSCYLSDILAGRRKISLAVAKLLEEKAREVLDKDIPWTAWIQNDITDHEAFCNKSILN